jgi:protocatechuate 3,4-dioxygenase beta subunit
MVCMSTAPDRHEAPSTDELQDHDRGLGFDLPHILSRRRMLSFAAGAAGLVALAACGSDSTSSSSTAAAPSTTAGAGTTASATATTAATAATAPGAATTGSIEEIPEETNGPYPADGSNGKNVLTESGVVRSDIRSSFGSSTTTAEGVPTTIRFQVLDTATGQPVEGAAVYVWHCDRDGNYSMYSNGVTGENYLRGVQPTDADGMASFASIYPACYSGRWPHVHFEVYPSVDAATTASGRLATSQIALTDAANVAVFATDGYEQSVRNYARVSLSSDNVFRDGVGLETPTVAGDVATGFVVTLPVGIAA